MVHLYNVLLLLSSGLCFLGLGLWNAFDLLLGHWFIDTAVSETQLSFLFPLLHTSLGIDRWEADVLGL